MLKMTLEQLHQFYSTNKQAARLMEIAFQDYVAARVCILNMCFSGLQLAAQAVEKQLKAALLFVDPSVLSRINRTHDLLKLAHMLEQHPKGVHMKSYCGHLKELNDAYNRRYPENWPKHFSVSTGDVKILDEVFCYLTDNMSIPDEVKYSWGMHSYIFDLWDDRPSPIAYWSREQNSVLNRDLALRKARVAEVATHLGLRLPQW